MKNAAIAYARAGHRIFPLASGTKIPVIEGGKGVHDATSDVAQIVAWWNRWPDANIGLAVRSNWLIVDVDVRSGGNRTLSGWTEQHGVMPLTPTQLTPTGGLHFIFQRPDHIPTGELRGKAGQGVDALSPGKYIVAAPSKVPAGVYQWIRKLSTTPIAVLPDWLVELVRRPPPPPAPMGEGETRADVIERARKYLDRCPIAISGAGGHNTTFIVAQRLVRGFGLDEHTAFSLLKEWNAKCQPPWRDADLRRKIKQAIERGTMQFGQLRDAERRS